VFGIDIDTCPACGFAVRIIARINFAGLYFQQGRTRP
jgi:hypothetical protein